ncbi:MAG: YidC/Oxa1 family membrane protein insertase [Planctomycetes bacterium]|nr:YidC/Oxa1 family membrane protein insertase [Planctomycetota bacterium]
MVDRQNQRLRTNLVRKSMEADKAVGDTSLKTLSFSGQSEHPRSVTTDTLEQWLAEGRPLHLVDVREPEEVEMGQVPGSWARRYPDLQADSTGLLAPGKSTILMCESGNRSSELCDWFFARGVAVQFVAGGYEKWVAEGRAMTGDRAHGTEIRATPDFPRKETLLDTPEVMALYQHDDVLFVDVRYPEDFARGHLPGAVNVPLRKMVAAEADAALRALPARPIVAVCYDKRSSFYGLLLGLRLHRLGADFRGRYTVPHEFALPQADSPWVAQWLQEQQGDTVMGMVGGTVGVGVGWCADRFGLLAAIVLLVVLLRAAMLPFSLAAERDQWVQRRFAVRTKELQQVWAHDPFVWRREVLRSLRANGVSPWRNVFGALLQILLFAAAFAGVDAAATGRPYELLGRDLAVADASRVLPIVFGVVLAGFIRLQQQNKARVVLPVLFTVVMTALVWNSRGAVLVYLTVSLLVMALQTVLHRRWLARAAAGRVAASPRAVTASALALAQAGDHLELGNKAVRLGRMIAAGLPVPDGFVVPPTAELSAERLLAAAQRHGVRRAAVRSSAFGEDGNAASMAGMFRSELDVDPAALTESIVRVRDSYGGRSGGVVVQDFRRARYSGVLFTVDPQHAGRMLVELVEGACEQVVGGTRTPRAFRFGRVTGDRIGSGDGDPGIPLAELLALARRIETLFGAPQDIEWVYGETGFEIVQARDITVLPGKGRDREAAVEAERLRLLREHADADPDAVVLEMNGVSELLPEPTTYSLALVSALWEAGGAVDLACRRAGVPYDVGVDDAPLVRAAFGRCYVATATARSRSRRSLSAVASFRLMASAQALEQEFRNGAADREAMIRRLAAIEPARLADADLLALHDEVRHTFVRSTYAMAESINIAAEAFVNAVVRRAARSGHDAAALLRDAAGTVVGRAFDDLAGKGAEQERAQRFLAGFGHRARHDFELAEPRWAEMPDQVRAMVAAPPSRGAARAPAVELTSLPRVLATAVDRARRFQSLKEDAKHLAMRELAVLRSLLRHIGVRFGVQEFVFDLLPDEVAGLADAAARGTLRQRAQQRAETRRLLLDVDAPTRLTRRSLERLADADAVLLPRPGELHGTRVAGAREVVGVVRVLHDVARLGELRAGEILVTRCTDPAWLPAFGRVAGIVTEVGGFLSHAAIQAREQDLATIVGVDGATSSLRTGELVRLGRDGRVERIADRRRPREAVDLPAQLGRGDAWREVRIRDLGVAGALVEVDDPASLPDGAFQLRFRGEVRDATMAWRNCTRAGVKFDSVGVPDDANAPDSGRPAPDRLSSGFAPRR